MRHNYPHAETQRAQRSRRELLLRQSPRESDFCAFCDFCVTKKIICVNSALSAPLREDNDFCVRYTRIEDEKTHPLSKSPSSWEGLGVGSYSPCALLLAAAFSCSTFAISAVDLNCADLRSVMESLPSLRAGRKRMHTPVMCSPTLNLSSPSAPFERMEA